MQPTEPPRHSPSAILRQMLIIPAKKKEKKKKLDEGRESSSQESLLPLAPHQPCGRKLVTHIQQALEDARHKLSEGSSTLPAAGVCTTPNSVPRRCPLATGSPGMASSVGFTRKGPESE